MAENLDLTGETIAATYTQLLHIGKTEGIEGAGTGHFITDANGTESVLSLDAGYVGIGTESPTALLTVGAITTLCTDGDGTTAVTPEGMNLHITEASKYAMGIKNADASGDGLIIQAGDASDDFALRVEDYDSANDLLVVQGGGNIGIGTAAPLAQLHIKGSDTTDQVIIENTDAVADTAPDLVLYRNSGSPAINDYIGNIVFRGRTDGPGDADYASIRCRAKAIAATGENSELAFFTMASGANTNTLMMKSGKVGIGNDDPGVLFVCGTINTGADAAGLSFAHGTHDGQLTVQQKTTSGSDIFQLYRGTVKTCYVDSDAAVFLTDVYTSTAGSANVSVADGGRLTRISSSKRYKDNIDYDDVDASVLYAMKPCSYIEKSTGTEFIGLIAEDMHEVEPRLVEYQEIDGKDEPDAIKYDHISAVLIKAIQELSAKVTALENA